MPDVSAIIAGLKERAMTMQFPTGGDAFEVAPLADAEAAVRSAVDARTAEIVKLVAGYDAYSPTGIMVRNDIAAEVARRFPNGGTNDGK